ncbi:MAG: chemotaxis protein CheW, partial [Demequina sp.]|nr:chemotaxis protein CheW [Demequina sp.]
MALSVDRVREVVGAPEMVALPSPSRLVPAVIEWRGKAIAVVDVGALVDAPPMDVSAPPSRFLIVEAAGEELALPVDAVREAAYLPLAETPSSGESGDASEVGVLFEVQLE